MSRSADRLRSPGEGPRQTRPTTPGDLHHAEVPAPQALQRRPRAAPPLPADGPVGSRGRGGALRVPPARRRGAPRERRVRRLAGARAGADLGALRRPGRRAGHDRRSAPRDQRPRRGLVHGRRRVPRARARDRGAHLLRAGPRRRAAARVDRRPGGHVPRAVAGLTGVIDEPVQPLDEGALRALVPRVLAGLVRRGEDFDAAEDALQEALLEALRVWPEHPPREPRAWLTTVATRRLVDARRSEAARQRREEIGYAEPRPGPTEEGDDTLFLLFCCCHPELSPASQVALTLRAVGGLTTHEIAAAFYVPEATMAQRISRAKRTLHGRRLDQPGDVAVVLRVLYLVYTAGHVGRVDLAGEAIRLARQLTLATEEPEARGLLALMLLNHARLPARLDPEGRIVTLDRQDRGRWDTRAIAEGVRVLQSALALQRPGRYQVEAGPSPPCTTTRQAPRRPTGRRSSPGTTTSSPSPTTRCTRTPPPCWAARSRSATCSVPLRGCARPTGSARCSATATGGTPSAATCTSSPATCRPPARRTRMPPAGPRTSPSATTWSVRPPARGPASYDPFAPVNRASSRIGEALKPL